MIFPLLYQGKIVYIQTNYQIQHLKMTFQQQRKFPHFFHPNGYYYDDESRYTATICAERVLEDEDDKPMSKKQIWERAERNNLVVEKMKTSAEYQAKWWYYYNFYSAYKYIFGKSFYKSSSRASATISTLPPNEKNFRNQICDPYRHGKCQLGYKCHFLHDTTMWW